MHELIEQKIEQAHAGDVEASKWLINEFCNTIRNNRDKDGMPHRKPSGVHTQFDESLLDYFADCFAMLLSGKDEDAKRITADLALNLTSRGKRGPKANSSTRKNHLLWGCRVHELHRNGEPLEDAIAKVGIEFNKAHETVRDAYAVWLKLLKDHEKAAKASAPTTPIGGKKGANSEIDPDI